MLDKPARGSAKPQGSGPPLDFQEHLARLDAADLLTRVERPINKETELHPLVRWQFQGGLAEDERRAFLFTNVVDSEGRRYETPVAIGALAASAQIYAIGMGRPVAEIGDAWMAAIANPIAPVEVKSASCQEVIIKGDDLRKPNGGLKSLPVPVSTPGYDAAPYLTATLCITEDPETGVRNMGTYRAGLKATDRLGVRMAARPGGAGGYLHWQKYRKLKKPMPIAIVIGCAPVVMFTGPQKLPIGCDEMAVAGGLAGAPIHVVKAATIDLHVPANAEVVIEGLIDPELLEPEGPFGESHGHVALEGFNMSMQVTAITRKRTPVWASILSEVTPSESSVMKRVAYEPRYLAYLRDSLAIKGVRSVVMHEALTNLRKVMFLQIAHGTPRTEIWRALHGAASLQADIGKYVIAVSEDIDARNPDAVFWSLAYRANPIKDVQISPYRSEGHGPKSEGGGREESTMLVDATLKDTNPPISLPKREFMEHARAIWDELGLPKLKPQSPWHGYSLGDWDAVWDTYAERAVTGQWEETGKETFAHRRGGLTPETPVKGGEKLGHTPPAKAGEAMSVAVFRNYDQAALDRQYDNGLKVGEEWLKGQRAHWVEQSSRARDSLPCTFDVPYDAGSGERLDIFRPRQASGLAPVQIYIHGGYWISNDKKDCSYVALGFTGAGFINVVINYTLIPGVRMHEQVRQCRAAVGWVHAHIREYGGDPDQIFVTGHSAGGHLSVSLLTDPDIVPGRIKGVTSLSGLYDLEPVRLSFVNDKLGLSERDVSELSPVRLKPRDTSPRLLLTMGAREGDEYLRQHNDLAAAWRPAMPHLVAPIIPDADHFTMRGALDDPNSDICRLIWKTMGKGKPS